MRGWESIQISNSLPSGKYAHIRVYDNGGKTIDRYTVVFDWKTLKYRVYDSLGMSRNPFHPQGYAQHGEAMLGAHLGRRIPFAKLPADCQTCVLRDLREGRKS